MCDGGGGGGDGPGGEQGNQAGGNPQGGSGGNVGSGNPGGGGGATGRGDQGQQGAVGAPGTVSGPGGISGMGESSEAGFEGAQGSHGDLNAGEAQAQRGGDEFGDAFDGETTSGMEGDPEVTSAMADALAGNLGAVATGDELSDAINASNVGAFGFDPLTGAKMAALTGSLPLTLMGLMMGFAQEGGNVDNYGGGDPNAGGGFGVPNRWKNTGVDAGTGGFTIGSMLAGSSGGGGEGSPGEPTAPINSLRFSGDRQRTNKSRVTSGDSDLLDTLVFDTDREFTRSLF